MVTSKKTSVILNQTGPSDVMMTSETTRKIENNVGLNSIMKASMTPIIPDNPETDDTTIPSRTPSETKSKTEGEKVHRIQNLIKNIQNHVSANQ